MSGLDTVLLAGWPGTIASWWQQAGRAGRRDAPALVVFVAADDPLDTYLVNHPDTIFGRTAEATVLDPANPYVLAPHLAAAAAELPLTEADAEVFGPTMAPLLDTLVARGVLRRRPRGWFWARDDRPGDHVSLRGAGQPVVRIVENRTGRVLGTVDAERAHRATHPGAVYVHQGKTYVVTELDLDDGSAHVTQGDPGWSTVARSTSQFRVVAPEREARWGPIRLCHGVIDVRTQVTSFLRMLPSGEVIGEHPLDLPEQRLTTRGVWWTVPPELLSEVVDEADGPGALHAAEHCAIAMLPLVAQSDRWDVGGVSTMLHPDTELPTVVVYDGYPGGAGFAERGFERGRRGCAARSPRSPTARAGRAARPASSHPSAGTATSRWTSRARAGCWSWCSGRPKTRPGVDLPSVGARDFLLLMRLLFLYRQQQQALSSRGARSEVA
ncbi:hypothetical protein GCM10025872_02360 [Barrientosiimonas endolithica]|uniref:Helicase C-terminal domain-containing protein n=1 Tax=Barrientosiimonas endolithica TaxID=1535208 RepID=A0ABM8H746_9MICO|nr:hypothetical protein GCM10025872_02360 [Barrientosiimonas endolithica]